MTRRQRRLQEKRRRHGRQLAVGAGATVGATLLMGGVANAANVTVDSLADAPDPGHTTLRDALHVVNTSGDPSSLITFASGLTGTINLTSRLTTFYPVSIEGPGADRITISGQDNVRILYAEPASPETIDVTVSGLTLAHGHAEGTMNNRLGGAIFAYNTNLTVSNAVLSQNTAAGSPGTDGYGGAICICTDPGGSLRIENSTLSGNTASSFGGAVYDDFAPLTIENSTINDNSARGGGGVSVYNTSGSNNIKNTTLSGNEALDFAGGGLYSYDRSDGFTLTSVTVAGNAASQAGGIWAEDGNGPLTLQNTIVANNTAPTNPDIAGPFNSAFSLIRTPGSAALTDIVPGSLITGQDPQLNGLAANGGPTLTMAPALTSPAIDKGAAFGLNTDQRGATRPVEIPTIPNSSAPGADGSDIGAFEVQNPTPVPTKKKKCKKKHKKHKRFAESAKKKHKKAKCKKKKKKKR
jgi:hypothetical protein